MPDEALSRAFTKRTRGEPLTEKERQLIKDYTKKAVQLSTRIYWDSPEQKGEYEALAEEAKARNFSKWLIQQIERGAKASPHTREEVARLYDEIEKGNARYEHEAENCARFRESSKKLERERDEARERNRELEDRVEELEEEVRQMKEKEARKGAKK